MTEEKLDWKAFDISNEPELKKEACEKALEIDLTNLNYDDIPALFSAEDSYTRYVKIKAVQRLKIGWFVQNFSRGSSYERPEQPIYERIRAFDRAKYHCEKCGIYYRDIIKQKRDIPKLVGHHLTYVKNPAVIEAKWDYIVFCLRTWEKVLEWLDQPNFGYEVASDLMVICVPCHDYLPQPDFYEEEKKRKLLYDEFNRVSRLHGFKFPKDIVDNSGVV